jgi:NADPH:quinone reductase-like Zn-dependent oxidoreductase
VVVSETGADLADAVKAVTGGKLAYAAVECVGGDMFAAVASAVRNGGTVIIYG